MRPFYHICVVVLLAGSFGCSSSASSDFEGMKSGSGGLESSGRGKGNLVIVGGGPRPESIMNKIVELSTDRSMLIIPMASSIPDTVGWEQRDQFYGYGAREVDILIMDDNDKYDPAIAEQIRNARGIWFSGGDQNRLMDYLGDGILIEAIHEAYQNGAVISGTSAGAAVMSRVMITGDELYPDPNRAFATISKDNVITTTGIGLINTMIIDQHFIRRSRLNRLISTMLDHPEQLAAGIDEATALWVQADGMHEVLGDGQVIVLMEGEQRDVESRALHAATGIQMHILTPGSSFYLTENNQLKVQLRQQ
jgi:cyanophycinase